MVDLTEICGESALHTSLLKKRAAAQAKLDMLVAKATEKIAPLENQIEKLDAMIAILVPSMEVADELQKAAHLRQQGIAREVAPQETAPAADTAADVPAFLKRGGV